MKRSKEQVGMREVANRALVSIGTVSRVLNNYPNVEASLRLRVLEAVNELGYVHRTRRVDGGASEDSREVNIKHITFCYRNDISPHLSQGIGNTYFPLVLHGAEAECRQQNLHLHYRIIEDDEDELPLALEALTKSKAEAMILVNFVNHTLVGGLLELGLPAVLIDHYFPDLPLDAVMNDSYHGAYQLVQYLLRCGHRKIAFVNGLPHYTIERRYDAYRRALEAANIEFEPEWLLPGNLQVEGGIAAADEYVARKLDCTAVFCANDETAFGFIQKMAMHKIRVPDEVSVVGFDDVEAARFITPALTTIRSNAPALGRMAIRKLLERASDPSLPITQTMVRAELIERNSVLKLV